MLLVLAFQQFLSAAILSGVAILLLELPRDIHLEKTIYSIGYIAIFQTLVAFGLQIISQQRTDPVRVFLILTRAIAGLLIFVATLSHIPAIQIGRSSLRKKGQSMRGGV